MPRIPFFSFPPAAPARSAPRGRSALAAFTIVELLVVIGILTVLLGLLLPALRSARITSRQSVELSAARQLMLAYVAYANSNEDTVLPGYKSGLPARDATGKLIADITIPVAAARYPWRLAPYLDYNISGLYTNDQQELLEEMQQSQYSWYVYISSLSPALGLNATWVGGNDQEDELGTGSLTTHTFGRYWVTRSNEVRHAERLMVFASARGIDPVHPMSKPVEGYFEVRSPWLTQTGGYRWSEEFNPNDPQPLNYGYLSPRYRGNCVSAFFDGHSDILSKDDLKDMRYWANRAETADYALTPLSSAAAPAATSH